MDFDAGIMKQLIETFQVELEEKTQIITDGLINLEKNKLAADERVTLTEEILRAAHNIKGSARGVGVNDVGAIAHYIESFFSSIQQKSIDITQDLIDLCLEAVDKMRAAMQAFVEKSALPFDLDDLLKRLEKGCLVKKKEVKTSKEKGSSFPSAEPAPLESKQKVKDKKNIVVTNKTTDNKTIHVSLNSLDRVSAVMEEMQVNKIAIVDHYFEINKLSEMMKQFKQLWKQSLATLKIQVGQELGEPLAKLYSSSADSLEEMGDITYKLHKNMEIQINELSSLSNTLQEEVRMLRLIPATSLLRSLPRYVRDLSIDLDKHVDLVIHGDEVKIDKMILEAIQDPLNHLLRNALDHGIESAEIRKQNGKPEIGTISIDVREEGSHICIKLSDDGAGIDVKKIALQAVNKNIISKSELENLADNDILNLIFRPGFSTKESITQVSGRGVGLDVVKANIEDLKGSVHVTTAVGKGTTFTLQVPLTLASERGFLIRCGGQLFIIPTNTVERVLILHPEDIVDVEASQAILLDNHPVFLLTLAEILHLEKQEAIMPSYIPVIVIKKGWQVVALVVDEIIGEREIVIKSLQAPLMSISCVAGGTLSGSGQVIIVLDAYDIVNIAFHMVKSTHIALKSEVNKEKIRPHILVVDDSITTRTLEKSILESKDYQVTVAVDGVDAWEILQKQKFSLLITDVMMPNMDGFTLTEHVKKSEKLHDLPVIIVTSLGSEEEKKRGIKAGADYYIIKNEFESGALLEIVEQLV